MTTNITPGGPSTIIDFQRSYGTHWTTENIQTISEWITISSYNIQCLERAARYHRSIIRNNTILGLILSTLSGTLSVTQFGISDPLVSMILNGIFTLFTFTIAVYTGFIKIYAIQERLEQFIKLKSDWTTFSTPLASEFQLPIELRRDALFIITKNKTIYLDLLKTDVEIPNKIQNELKLEYAKKTRIIPDLDLEISTLPEIMMDICRKTLEESHIPLLANESKNSPDSYMLPINASPGST
jgi:hypothetical protein